MGSTMDDRDWLESVPRRQGSTLDDVETAKLVLTYETLPAELAEGDRITRLVQLDVLEIRQKSGSDEYEYRKIVHIGNARWPVIPAAQDRP
jgi:hypothetical protein